MNRKLRRQAAQALAKRLAVAKARKDASRKAEEAHVRTIARRGSGMRTCLDILMETTLPYHQPHVPYEVAEVPVEHMPRKDRKATKAEQGIQVRLVALADLVNGRRA